MTTEELYDKLKLIQKMKCETQNLELKSAEQGYPKRLYDSLSSFSIRMMVALLFLELMRNKIIKKLVFMMLRTFKRKLTSNACR